MNCHRLVIAILMMLLHYYISEAQVVEIGFDRSEYAVSETDGSLTAKASVLNGIIPDGESVILRVDTQSGTALGGEDFMTITNRQLVFNENVTSEEITVVIIQDNIPEDNENFFIIIRDPTEQNNSTIVKRANIMLSFGGLVKINIVSSGNEPVDQGLRIGLGVGLTLLLALVGVGVVIGIYFKYK